MSIDKSKKQQYEKPKVEEIQLVAEEAVLTACKSDLFINPDKTQGQCNAGVSCFTFGS